MNDVIVGLFNATLQSINGSDVVVNGTNTIINESAAMLKDNIYMVWFITIILSIFVIYLLLRGVIQIIMKAIRHAIYSLIIFVLLIIPSLLICGSVYLWVYEKVYNKDTYGDLMYYTIDKILNRTFF